jgi:hypothetical protein
MQWWHLRKPGGAGFLILVFLLVVPACKLPEPELPTSGSPSITTTVDPTITAGTSGTGVTAPQIVSPASGSDVDEPRPTLVVSNASASDGSAPNYAFQVATNNAFTEIVDSVNGVAQGGNGQTSWRVSERLDSGKYFWRAQATVGSSTGPPTSTANFRVQTGEAPDAPQGKLLISDDLINGSMGDVRGGRFIPQGWQVIQKSDYIRYEVPPISSGFVEWENMGLAPSNPDPNTYMLFGMWDPSKGDYRTNPFRVHVQKLDTNHNPPYIRLRWISQGQEHDEGFNFLGWNPSRVYQWRVEWGSEGSENAARVSVDGQVIIRLRYGKGYTPDTHWIELGIAARHESIIGAVYRNLRIGRN